MTKSFLLAITLMFAASPVSSMAQEPQQPAAAVFQRGVGLWIVANVYMGNPMCYRASIAQENENTYRITVKSAPHEGVMCTMEMGMHPVSQLFNMPLKPPSVKIGIGTDPFKLYSVGNSNPEK